MPHPGSLGIEPTYEGHDGVCLGATCPSWIIMSTIRREFAHHVVDDVREGAYGRSLARRPRLTSLTHHPLHIHRCARRGGIDHKCSSLLVLQGKSVTG